MPLKVTDGMAPGVPDKRQSSPESLRELSSENRDATVSPATMDAAPFDKDKLKEALNAAKRLTEFSNSRLKFEYQEEADVFQVSVVGGEGDVIRKIPPDVVLRMVENLKRFRGAMLDTKA